MGTIKRTEKEICIANLTENVIRRMAALAGLESHCLNMDWDRFEIKDRFIGRNSSGMTCSEPDSRDISNHGFVKENDGIEINIKMFDTDIRVWNNGHVQGYYNSDNGGTQYAANMLEWSNLMLDAGFFEFID